MQHIEVGFPRWESRDDLIRLWSEVFGDTPAVLQFFFDTVFSPENTLVVTADGKIVSALYLLPAALSFKGKHRRAHYIYAAATAPDFRSRGYMDRLLQEAAIVGEKRGDAYSILLPSQDSLYSFYAGKGYRELFRNRVCTFGRTDTVFPSVLRPADSLQICAIRSQAEKLLAKDGIVVWGKPHVDLSFHFYRAYGGSVWTDGNAYAFCEPMEDDVLIVREILSGQEDAVCSLMNKIRSSFLAEEYQFHLPHSLCMGEGTLERHGMIKPLCRSLSEEPSNVYLGLALE